MSTEIIWPREAGAVRSVVQSARMHTEAYRDVSILSDYQAWHGPNPDNASGHCRSLAQGPRSTHLRGPSGLSRGQDPAMRKGPQGLAKGSQFTHDLQSSAEASETSAVGVHTWSHISTDIGGVNFTTQAKVEQWCGGWATALPTIYNHSASVTARLGTVAARLVLRLSSPNYGNPSQPRQFWSFSPPKSAAVSTDWMTHCGRDTEVSHQPPSCQYQNKYMGRPRQWLGVGCWHECLISGIPFALHIKNMRIFTIVPTATSAHYGTLHPCLVTTT
ncbi:hypothetical protein GWK47_036717 [Chionoecetes opilio]|uniref:Uncharacterized protein n=1 Tax=Chionoecetes opilio TaxID=41210 RepID=A0A8J5CMX9_CHIOP|nr:hypothetical protein GWK47_036717 [Chionoecetes opilio]